MATTKQTKVLTSAIGVDDNKRVYTTFTDATATGKTEGILPGQLMWMVGDAGAGPAANKLVARVVYADGTAKKCVLDLVDP
jgi:hypothetical protein